MNKSLKLRFVSITFGHKFPKAAKVVPALRAFWDLEKTVLPEIRVSGINEKIPHLHIHKPKTVVVETVLVIFV